MALDSAAAAGVPSISALTAQVLLLSVNISQAAAMESDKLEKTATTDSALTLMVAATAASPTVDTTVQEILVKDQLAHQFTPAVMPSMSPTMTRGVIMALLLAVLLYAKSNLAGDATIFLISRPTAPSYAAMAELILTMANNAMTPISLLVTVAVPSA